MTDTTGAQGANASAAQSNAAQGPRFGVQRVYLKDLSLEVPNAPQIFLETTPPELDVQLNVAAQMLAEGLFEVTVMVTVTTKAGDKVVYLVEAKQGGIFEIAGLPMDQIDAVLHIACPTVIYPYLRANVADAISRASFPALHLQEVNFQAYYQQRLQAMAEQQKAGGPGNGAANGAGIILPPGAGR